MYIPLDNLYDWIAGAADDIIIYRFYPHGSKKIQDFRVIDQRYRDWGFWHQWGHAIPVLCHDQEPLDFDAYDFSQQQWQNVRDLFQTTWPDRHLYRVMHDSEYFWQEVAHKNLAGTACDTLVDRVILLHSEKNSPQVTRYSDLCCPVYWWSHAIIARDWYRFAEHDARLCFDHADFPYLFNIYARAWSGTREYRLTLLRLVQQENLEQQCRVTFNTHDGGHYTDHVFRNSCLALTGAIGFYDQCQSAAASATYDASHYTNCAIDIVLETLFDDARHHLTEKTLRPMACGKPFFLAGTAGSLQYLREYGFCTFQDLWDESYDLIRDPLQRLTAMINEMQRLARLPLHQQRDIVYRAHQLAKRNKAHFFSAGFGHAITGELEHNLHAARDVIRRNWSSGRTVIKAYRGLGRANRQLMRELMWHPDYTTHCGRSLLASRGVRSTRQSDHSVPVLW